MCKLLVPAALGAVTLTCALAASAQTSQAQPDPNQALTVTGCVAAEADVLKRPAVAGKIGLGDEFVLTRATVKTGAPLTGTPPPQMEPPPPEPSGTSGTVGLGKIYRTTGDKESELKPHLGHRVEIVGRFKHAADAQAELGVIGTTGKPPAAPAEPTAMNTPEITIDSIRMLSETCGG